MKTFNALAVTSAMEPGAISIRDRSGRSSGFKSGMAVAGFRDGERIVVVDEASFEEMRRKAEELDRRLSDERTD